MTKLTKKQESLLNELLEDFKGDPESVLGQHGLMNELRKREVEAMLDGELTNHLGYASHDPAGHGTGNSRNGYSAKKVQSKDGELELIALVSGSFHVGQDSVPCRSNLNPLHIKHWLAFYSVQPYLAHPVFIIVFYTFQHT